MMSCPKNGAVGPRAEQHARAAGLSAPRAKPKAAPAPRPSQRRERGRPVASDYNKFMIRRMRELVKQQPDLVHTQRMAQAAKQWREGRN